MPATDAPDPSKGRFVDRLVESSHGDDMSAKLARQLRSEARDEDRGERPAVTAHESIALATLRSFGFSGDRDAGLLMVQRLLDLDGLAADADGDIEAFAEAVDEAIEGLATAEQWRPMFTGARPPAAEAAKASTQRQRRAAADPRDRSAPRRVPKSPATMTTAEVSAAARRPPDDASTKKTSDRLRQQGGFDQEAPQRPAPWWEKSIDDRDPDAATKRFSKQLLGLDARSK